MEATLDAGAVGIRYADSVDAAAATLSPSIRILADRATIGAAGSISEFGTNAWTTQALLNASVFTSPVAAVRGELVGNVAGSAHQDGTRTGQLEALGRIHLMRAAWGIWAGAGIGRGWDGTSGHALLLGDAGAWWHRHSFTAVLSATPTKVSDSVRYVDGGLAVSWLYDRAELGASLGARAGHGLIATSGTSAWGILSGVVWLTPHVGLVASAGNYPPDLTQGFPNGRFASLALRLNSHREWPEKLPIGDGRAAFEVAAPDSMTASERSGIEQFMITSAENERTIRVRAPLASHVDLSGDVTNWAPLALTAAVDGWWVTTITVSRGMHQVSLRLNGGRWVAPPGTVEVRDDFDGVVGIWQLP